MGDAVTFGPYELLKVVGGEDAGRIEDRDSERWNEGRSYLVTLWELGTPN